MLKLYLPNGILWGGGTLGTWFVEPPLAPLEQMQELLVWLLTVTCNVVCLHARGIIIGLLRLCTRVPNYTASPYSPVQGTSQC